MRHVSWSPNGDISRASSADPLDIISNRDSSYPPSPLSQALPEDHASKRRLSEVVERNLAASSEEETFGFVRKETKRRRIISEDEDEGNPSERVTSPEKLDSSFGHSGPALLPSVPVFFPCPDRVDHDHLAPLSASPHAANPLSSSPLSGLVPPEASLIGNKTEEAAEDVHECGEEVEDEHEHDQGEDCLNTVHNEGLPTPPTTSAPVEILKMSAIADLPEVDEGEHPALATEDQSSRVEQAGGVDEGEGDSAAPHASSGGPSVGGPNGRQEEDVVPAIEDAVAWLPIPADEGGTARSTTPTTTVALDTTPLPDAPRSCDNEMDAELPESTPVAEEGEEELDLDNPDEQDLDPTSEAISASATLRATQEQVALSVALKPNAKKSKAKSGPTKGAEKKSRGKSSSQAKGGANIAAKTKGKSKVGLFSSSAVCIVT